MCRRRSEGISYIKCGHYIQTKFTAKIDCRNRRCTKSILHPPECTTCEFCEQYYYPDDQQKITSYSDSWCHLCEPWYGESARRGAARR